MRLNQKLGSNEWIKILMKYAKFARIYKTTILSDSYKKVISDPVKIEIFRGPKSYQVPFQLSRVIPLSHNYPIARDAILSLNSEHQYIALITRTKITTGSPTSESCKDEIDQVITYLSAIYNPFIFSDHVYSGWIRENENDGFVASALVTPAEKLDIDENNLTASLKNIRKQLAANPDMNDRFRLMSRFWSKAVVQNPTEEQFLFLWTILEVYPNERHIKH